MTSSISITDATEKMRAAGATHGKSRASWYFDGNTTPDAYARVLRGIEDDDPEVLDTFPDAPLSGEWADEPTPASVFRDVLDLDLHAEASFWGRDATDALLDAYEQAFSEAVHAEIERAARAQS